MRTYKFLDTVFNMKRDRAIFDEDPRLLQRSVSAFQRVAPHAFRSRERFHSQFGQDILVAEVLCAGRPGFFVDVGARCGEINSNSLALERAYGWKGLLVEPERENFRNVQTVRSQPAFNLAVSDREGQLEFVSFSDERGHSKLRRLAGEAELAENRHETYVVDVAPIRSILERAGVREVDYLDIDVEGEELAAIRGIDFKAVRFGVVAVESNTRRHDEIRRLMGERGFVPLCRLGVDVFYVPEAAFAAHCERLDLRA